MQKEVETTEKVKGISTRVIIVLAILAVFVAALYFLTDEIVLEGETAFDDTAYSFFQKFQTPQVTSVMIFLTFLGSIKFLFPAYVLLSLYFIFLQKKQFQVF